LILSANADYQSYIGQTDASATVTLSITNPPTGSITGKVLSFTGAPIDGADIEIEKWDDREGSLGGQLWERYDTIYTDENGVFRIDWLVAGEYRVYVDSYWPRNSLVSNASGYYKAGGAGNMTQTPDEATTLTITIAAGQAPTSITLANMTTREDPIPTPADLSSGSYTDTFTVSSEMNVVVGDGDGDGYRYYGKVYKVYLNAGTAYTFTSGSTVTDAYLRLFGPGLSMVTEFANHYYQDATSKLWMASIEYTPSVAGYYYLLASPRGSDSVGTFTVTITEGGKAPAGSEVVNAPAGSEVVNAPAGNVEVHALLTSLAVAKGKSLTLPFAAYDEDGNAVGASSLTWKSSNTKVATVKNGKVTAKKAGKVTITVSDSNGKKLKTFKITVAKKAVAVKKVTVKKVKKLNVGDTATLKVTLNPKGATLTGKGVTFTSSNKKVLSVDKAGNVTALKTGKAKITVKAGGKKATVTVTVK
jgi:uncharacterized protein YjdB